MNELLAFFIGGIILFSSCKDGVRKENIAKSDSGCIENTGNDIVSNCSSHEYESLMKEIYRKNPEAIYKDNGLKGNFCTGKFDGANEDRIGLFPIGLTMYNNLEGFSWEWCKSVKLLSEKGTVPELILNWPDSNDGISFSEGFSLNYDGSCRFTLKSEPDKKTGKDKLIVEYYDGEGGYNYFYATYEIIDNKWNMTSLINETECEDEDVNLGDRIFEWNGKKWIQNNLTNK